MQKVLNQKAKQRSFLLTSFSLLSLLLWAEASSADSIGLSAKASTLGLGVELDYPISKYFSLRLQKNSYSYSDTFEEDDIDYNGEFSLDTLGGLIDWHVFGGAFHLSAGFYSNNNELSGVASGDGEYEIGDRAYLSDPSDPVHARLAVSLGSSSTPYLGLGWGNSPKNDGGFMGSFDIGVFMSGSPKASLKVSGSAVDLSTGLTVDMVTDPTVQGEVDKEVSMLEDDLSDFDVYPVIMFGLGYRF